MLLCLPRDHCTVRTKTKVQFLVSRNLGCRYRAASGINLAGTDLVDQGVDIDFATSLCPRVDMSCHRRRGISRNRQEKASLEKFLNFLLREG